MRAGAIQSPQAPALLRVPRASFYDETSEARDDVSASAAAKQSELVLQIIARVADSGEIGFRNQNSGLARIDLIRLLAPSERQEGRVKGRDQRPQCCDFFS
jgi:hypothetical protein